MAGVLLKSHRCCSSESAGVKRGLRLPTDVQAADARGQPHSEPRDAPDCWHATSRCRRSRLLRCRARCHTLSNDSFFRLRNATPVQLAEWLCECTVRDTAESAATLSPRSRLVCSVLTLRATRADLGSVPHTLACRWRLRPASCTATTVYCVQEAILTHPVPRAPSAHCDESTSTINNSLRARVARARRCRRHGSILRHGGRSAHVMRPSGHNGVGRGHGPGHGSGHVYGRGMHA
eukprot:37996-Prymnesium_polylepis.1